MIQIKLKKLKKSAIVPSYQTAQSAATDICAAIDEPITIAPFGRALVPSGFAMALPVGYEAQIRARSGLALKHGITMANGIGTIDADYRGEIGVILLNLGNEDFIVQPGDRIAQMVITRHETVNFKEVDKLDETLRGKGGFGSTG